MTNFNRTLLQAKNTALVALAYVINCINLLLLNTVKHMPNNLLNLAKPFTNVKGITVIGSGQNFTDCTIKFFYYYRISNAKNFLKTHLGTDEYIIVYTPSSVQYINLEEWITPLILLDTEFSTDLELNQPTIKKTDMSNLLDNLAKLNQSSSSSSDDIHILHKDD